MYDFNGQLHDLLSDRSLFGDPNNLVVNQRLVEDPELPDDTPFTPYKSTSDGLLDEVLDGSWYQDTVKVTAEDGSENGHDFILPIIIYVDKTGTDAYQRHSLEPVLFTLGVFNRATRNQTRAWRILGFVPDLEQTSSAVKKAQADKNRGLSVRNYHKCLAVVLQSFVETQKQKPDIFLRIGDWVKRTKPRLPLAFVIGDAKSGDTLCGRYGGHKTQRMCRACTASYAECDDPYHQCQMVASSNFDEYSALASEKFDVEEFKHSYDGPQRGLRRQQL